MTKSWGNKERLQYCTDPPGQEILSPSSSRSFRTQSHWSFITGQCINSERFRVHLSINLHSIMNSRLTPGGQNLSKRQTVLFISVDPMNKKHKDPDEIDLNAPRLAWYKQEVWKKPSKKRCIGSTSDLLKGKDFSSIKHDRTQSSFTTRFQLILSRGLSRWKLENSNTREYLRHFDHLKRFPFKIIGWKNWIQKLLEVVKTPSKPNQRPKIQF